MRVRLMGITCSQEHTILLITSHNALLRLDLHQKNQDTIVKPKFELHCEKRPLLWSACFSRSRYEEESDVYIAVGTIMNVILVWRPFVDQGRIERRLIGHHVSYIVARNRRFFDILMPDV